MTASYKVSDIYCQMRSTVDESTHDEAHLQRGGRQQGKKQQGLSARRY